MKRILFILLAATMSATLCSAAMSNSKVRKETLFLTDKMAYELNLNTEQYNDVYEINYDFIDGIRYLMDDVMRGEEWALNRYYDNLDVRNDDLRWVLSSRQYGKFMQASYFYRPIYITGGRWQFRVYINYTNRNYFYFPRPYHYRTYCGGHYRTHYNNISYYRGRYNHVHYNGSYRIRDDRTYHSTRRSDFGSVNIRPNSGTRPGTSTRPSTSIRPTRSSSTTGRSSRSDVSNRESGNTRRSDVENTKTKDNNSSSTRRGSSTGRVSTESKTKDNSSGVRSSGSSTRRSSSSSTRSSGSSSRSSERERK